ncbi:MAG TPA: glycoside hydrolase family 43 protein, partial [Flavisolibacter sp.]|nr:glycoside hydrolase family 43 protein [Flavisolibacter sp.]
MSTKGIVFIAAIFVHLFAWSQVSYQNPVIPGFYSDPSVCRVADDYYMVHSSFGYFPGVPIFHSKNLVDWKQIGSVLTRKEQLPLEKAGVTLGIFAPTIRFHDGVFYMITTNITAKGNFYVTAKDPAGEWSDPIWIEAPGIDPSLFFDDDGKVYVTSTVNYGNVPNKGIRLSEIDVKTGKLLTASKNIWTGTGARFPEGPHLYKKDGWYYLMIAEGGTEYGHKVAISRSKYIDGPYLSNPANPILTHINANAETSPIQGVGHGDLVQTQDGSWFMVAHAFRQTNSHQILGRETFLAPVRWDKNAWPVVNGDGTVSFNMEAPFLPGPPLVQKTMVQRDDFNENKLSFEWNYLNNPVLEYCSLTARKGYLRLLGNDSSLAKLPNVTFVGRRQQHFHFSATTLLDFTPKKENEEAGIALFKDAAYQYTLSVKNAGGKRVLALRYHLGRIRHTEKEVLLQDGSVQLRITGTQESYAFEYSQANGSFQKVGEVDTRFLSA